MFWSCLPQQEPQPTMKLIALHARCTLPLSHNNFFTLHHVSPGDAVRLCGLSPAEMPADSRTMPADSPTCAGLPLRTDQPDRHPAWRHSSH